MFATQKARRLLLWSTLAAGLPLVVSCSAQTPQGRIAPPGSESSHQSDSAQGAHAMKSAGSVIAITSEAFQDGQPIPKKYTEDGENLSPPLAWTYTPKGTRQWALICDDPDAPTPQPWVHWVIYSIPGEIRSLPQGVETTEKLPEVGGAMQGKNSWPTGQTIGYRGPAPPKGHGVHHYHFKLYALDTALALKPEMTKAALEKAIEAHILGTGEVIGTYERR
jgi:Raf kinase inhibitor-like YbhB/YbcL family protein